MKPCHSCSKIIPNRNKYCLECRTLFLEEYNNNRKKILRECLHCGKFTINPKFCSSSCAAIVNNQKIPKRHPEGRCKICRIPISSSRLYCNECWKQRNKKDWSIITLGDLKNGNANNYGYPQIRLNSRRVYRQSAQPMACKICGYNLHVDVCHIKDIKSFGLDTPVSIINDLTNLVALCKNHHWEFDNGLCELEVFI